MNGRNENWNVKEDEDLNGEFEERTNVDLNGEFEERTIKEVKGMNDERTNEGLNSEPNEETNVGLNSEPNEETNKEVKGMNDEMLEDEPMDVLDVLLDEDNCEPIVLIDDKGKKIAFEQIAVIPYDEKIYCILKPIDEIKGVADDEAIVFYVDEREGKVPTLLVETDELKSVEVFLKYYEMIDEADGEAVDD